MTIFVLMLSNYIRQSETILLTSPILSQVIGFELIIPLISTSTVLNDSSRRLSPCFCRATKMLLADLICRSHTPPILFTFGGLYLQIKHCHPSFVKKPLIFFFSISLNVLFSSVLTPTKLLPMLLRIILIFLLLLMSLLSARIKLSVVIQFVVPM